ncbi:MAG TPA: 50S ribosomal protein L17 [Candidatus Paceibacterota bacterium]|nr:50S ribosomal protein L17 [Candidatus Paceibacterota bacterium]
MQHHKKGRTFGRLQKQRTALLRGLARDLILNGVITTTVAKAKEVRPFAERLITKGKTDSVATRRFLASELGNADDAVAAIVTDVAPKYKERMGGYTRIIKLGKIGARSADMAKIELV